MANLLERVEELHRRVTEINRLDEEGQPETDALVRRVEALERDDELQWRCLRTENESELLARIRLLDERLESLEQRVPKPIPVVEPLAERVIRDAHEACGESPVFAEPPAEPIPLPVMNDDGLNEQSLRALSDGPFGPAVVQHWKERAERAESLVAESRERIIDLLSTEGTMGGFKAREQARVFIDLARARVAKAGP